MNTEERTLNIMFGVIDWWFHLVYQWEVDHKAPAAASLIATVGMLVLCIFVVPWTMIAGLVYMVVIGLGELARLLWRSTHGK